MSEARTGARSNVVFWRGMYMCSSLRLGTRSVVAAESMDVPSHDCCAVRLHKLAGWQRL